MLKIHKTCQDLTKKGGENYKTYMILRGLLESFLRIKVGNPTKRERKFLVY